MRGHMRLTAIGNLGRDPDIRTTRNGKSVANMSVAVNEQWNDKDGVKQERVEWVRCVLWGALADIAARYLHKGDAVYIEGRLQTREWDDREGNKRKNTEVVVSNLIMLGGNSRQQVEQSEHPDDSPRDSTNGWDNSPQQNGKPDAREEVDDVPF